jgi:hypothetical protein
MSTVSEIAEALPKLSDDELRQVERVLRAVYRKRQTAGIYTDAYGNWTEEDQMAAAAQTFAMFDREEEAAKKARWP